MTGFLIWFIRNPMILLAALAIAAAATQVIPWGLGLSATCVAVLFADAAHHIASHRKERGQRHAAEVEAEIVGNERVTSFRDWLNEKDQQRTDMAA